MQERKRGLFDTGVLLKFFLGEKDKEIVRKLLDKVVLKEIEGFILACAFIYGCTRITYDPEFEGVKEIEIIKPNTFLDRLKE